ncbi:MAG: hypothetical protein M0R17_05195 [Candidatus Omnitrophica bacterium]|jgi:ribosomal protein L37AE/L43A|nr:hypothetical protein [Candidatus Omnitrophota bacterium]
MIEIIIINSKTGIIKSIKKYKVINYIDNNCIKNKHKIRDNKFGITWCVKCGLLLTIPCNKPLEEKDKVILRTYNNKLYKQIKE